MKSKFALSFGISLIFVGLVNIVFDTNNMILFGISLSSFVFTIISILFATKLNEEKYELLCIVPIIILLVFFCYGSTLSNYNVVKKIVESNITNVMTFISFGLFFVGEYITDKKNSEREQLRHQSMIKEVLTFSVLIRRERVKYNEKIIKKNVMVDEDSWAFINYVEELCEEKSKLADIKYELLKLNKDKYSIEEFSNIYTSNNKKIECIPEEKYLITQTEPRQNKNH